MNQIILESPNNLRQRIQDVGNTPIWFLRETEAIATADLWSSELKEVLLNEIDMYKAIELWLLSFHLGDPLHPLFHREENFIYIPYGELCHARLKLALHLFPRSFEAQKFFRTASEMWQYVEYSEFVGKVRVTGLGQELKIKELCEEPTLVGKTKFLSGKSIFKLGDGSIGGQISTFLECEAEKIAKSDSYFRENAYRDYLKAWTRLKQTIKKNDDLQLTYFLPNGEVFETGKGKSLPTRKAKSKGFGKRKYKEHDKC